MADEPRQGPGINAWLGGIVIGLVVIALIVAAYSAGYDEGKQDAEPAAPAARTQPPATVAGPGREAFASTCGGCHTLKAAGTRGTAGPSLDELRPDAAQVQAAIRDGGTGSGAMPRGLLSGRKAEQVADFVAAATAR